MSNETHRFKVGAFECIAVRNFTHTCAASRFFTNAPAERLEQVLRERELEPDVTLTHAHPDHVGGNVDESGRPVFANARYVMWRDEWDFWTSESTLETEPAHRVQIARGKLLPIEGQLDLVDHEAEIVLGIHAVGAKGHTPGHMAVAVSPGGEQLIYASDAALHQIHLEHPEWHTHFYDRDLEQAASTRRRLFDRAAAETALVFGAPFLSIPKSGPRRERRQGMAVAAD